MAVVDAPLDGLISASLPIDVAATKAKQPAKAGPDKAAPAAKDKEVAKPLRPWEARPDPPATPGPELAPKFGLVSEGHPLLASMNGPFVIDVPLWYAEEGWYERRIRAGAGRDPLKEPTAKPPMPVIDMRTGAPAGEFTWKAPVWKSNCILSPDGKYIVGPDSEIVDRPAFPSKNPLTRRDGLLFVWKQGAPEPVAKLQLTGTVAWLDFTAPDRIAMLTYQAGPKPAPALQTWDIVKGAALHTVALPAEDFPFEHIVPDAKGFPHVKFFYVPRWAAGAVSPGGRYVALAGRRSIVVVSVADGRVAGELPLPYMIDWLDHHGMSFRADGAELIAVICKGSAYDPSRGIRSRSDVSLRSWRMDDGSPRVDQSLADPELCDAPLAGPFPNSVLIPQKVQQGQRPSDLWPKHTFHFGAVVDAGSGASVLPLEYRALRWAGKKQLLVFGRLKFAPHLPLPPVEVARRNKKEYVDEATDPTGAKKLREWIEWGGLYVVPFDETVLRKQSGAALAGFADRPEVIAADRSGVKASKPEPAAWAVPAATPTPLEPAPLTAVLPDWPAAFADAQAAILKHTHQSKPTYRIEFAWDRYDLRTGAKVGDSIPLWPWITKKGFVDRLLPTVAALTKDGSQLAVSDPDDAKRVDVWNTESKRLMGLVPYADAPIDSLAWSAEGRLLTLGAGKVTAWDVPAGKAVFEVDGGYVGPLQMAPGRGWLAASTPEHVDILDASTGRCLGRCQAPDIPAWAWHAPALLSPDGKTLVRVRNGGWFDPLNKGNGARCALQLWDMATGATSEIPYGMAPAKLLQWNGSRRLLAGNRANNRDLLIDLDAHATIAELAAPRPGPATDWSRRTSCAATRPAGPGSCGGPIRSGRR